MKTNKFYKYSAIILLLINISMVTFFLIKRKKHHEPRHEQAIKMLNLTNEQADQFKLLAKEHHQSLMEIKKNQVDLLDSYFKTLFVDTILTKEKDLAVLLEMETKKINSTYRHFQDVKAILNKEQLKNYPEFIEMAVKRILGVKGRKHPRK